MPALWNGLVTGCSGIRRIQNIDTSGLDVLIAGEVPAFDPVALLGHREARRLSRFVQFALVAAIEAVNDSGIDPQVENLERCGAVIGSGVGGLGEIEAQHSILLDKGPMRVSPLLVPKMMINAAACQICIQYGFQGPALAEVAACASATNAMGVALRLIQSGESDIILTGGSEASLTPLGVSGFATMRALSNRNNNPGEASRPFDRDRDGFVLGEGAGILVFEEFEHAKKRGAKVYAEVRGFGTTCDAGHITAPDSEGRGAARAMIACLDDAGLNSTDVNYINAHGTSTPLNDVTETRAIKRAFGEHVWQLAISSTKSMTGHSLGASGGIEAVSCCKMIQEGLVHPTINYESPDPDCDLDYVPNAARQFKISALLTNSFGFGGHNSVIALAPIS